MLLLKRKVFSENSTIGELSDNGRFLCYTLEDVVRSGKKIYGQTAIPAGTYELIMNMSNRFQKVMPLLLNVPCFEGVRIHGGNRSSDTLGCILVGMGKGKDLIYNCASATERVYKLINEQLKLGKAYITIE